MKASTFASVSVATLGLLAASWTYAAQTPAGTVSAPVDAAGLSHMLQDEKLARDTYLALYEKTGLRQLKNVAAAEQRHMDAVAALMETSGLDASAASLPRGEFTDPAFADLYANLVAKGSRSASDALAVGREIEKLDIADLDARIAQTKDAVTLTVYGNLREGSLNHLAAFSREPGAGRGFRR